MSGIHVGQRLAVLDGVRGGAVLLVMQYHFFHTKEILGGDIDRLVFNLTKIGWIGVDLFFVLSGFLITRLLLDARGRVGYFHDFYLRRVFRIFPLYYLYIALIFLVMYPLLWNRLGLTEQAKMRMAVEAWPFFVFHFSNIGQVWNGSFFGAGLGHMWSLAVEEQFYLLWPLIVYIVPGVRAFRIVCITGVVGVVILRCYLVGRGMGADAVYVFTPTRLDGLLLGSVLATFQPKILFGTERTAHTLAVLSMLLVAAMGSFGPRPDSSIYIYTIGFLLISLYFAYLIFTVLGLPERSWLRIFLEGRLLTGFGKYSYALYVFHPLVRSAVENVLGGPVLVGGSQLPWQVGFSAICTVLSVAIAYISWRVIELPALKFRDLVLSKAHRR